jgi:glucosyl-3-phosphoglycerate phosphatase
VTRPPYTTRLLLVRHGETEWNAQRRLQGQRDIALSPRGQEQAADLAAMVRALAPDRVIASDLARALQTSAALGYTPEADPRWREADLGAWTGQPIEALRQHQPDAYAAWRGGLFTPAGAEPFDTLRERVVAATEELLGTCKTALVVTHGGPIRAVCAHWLCLPPKRIVPVSPGSLTVLELSTGEHAASKPGGAKLHTFNWRSHGALLDAPD